MNIHKKVSVYIEIEQFSNIKYEYSKERKELLIDRILEKPFVYPYAYGFIPNTLASDNDEVDVLIISNEKIVNNEYYDVYIIGSLVMEDEKGMDEKILCVFEKDYENINDINDLDESIKNNIYSFFSNYKKNSIEKWSKVIGYINKTLSIKLYENCIIKNEVNEDLIITEQKDQKLIDNEYDDQELIEQELIDMEWDNTKKIDQELIDMEWDNTKEIDQELIDMKWDNTKEIDQELIDMKWDNTKEIDQELIDMDLDNIKKIVSESNNDNVFDDELNKNIVKTVKGQLNSYKKNISQEKLKNE